MNLCSVDYIVSPSNIMDDTNEIFSLKIEEVK